MPVIPPTPWSDILPGIQTGDVMIFTGGDAEATAVELLTMSSYSHAVMLYRQDSATAPWIWEESSLDGVTDPLEGTVHNGAQAGDATQLAQLIAGRGNVPYYRQLIWERPPGLSPQVLDFMEQWDGTPFGGGTTAEKLLDMGWDWIEGHYFGRDSGRAHMFCAMLVALTYQSVGLLDESHPPNYYSPGSFAPTSSDVVLRLGATFGPLIAVSFP